MPKPDSLNPVRTVAERLVSYNIEMTEVTGGTFWKAYTPGRSRVRKNSKYPAA